MSYLTQKDIDQMLEEEGLGDEPADTCWCDICHPNINAGDSLLIITVFKNGEKYEFSLPIPPDLPVNLINLIVAGYIWEKGWGDSGLAWKYNVV